MSEFRGGDFPWEFERSNFGVFDSNGVLVVDVDSGDYLGDARIANANLIAAAPDLLEALDKITKEYIFTRGQLNGDFEDDLVDVLCIKNARAAIAKALGETK